MQTSDIILHSNVVPQLWDELLALNINDKWDLQLIQRTEMSAWSCIGQYELKYAIPKQHTKSCKYVCISKTNHPIHCISMH
jgi:hypothetical protein